MQILHFLKTHLLRQRHMPASGSVEPTRIRFEFANGLVSLNGTKLRLPVLRQDVIGLLGEPSRGGEEKSTILTWDDLGVHAFQRSEKVTGIEISLVRGRNAFSPKSKFAGILTVEGIEIFSSTSIDKISPVFCRARNPDGPFRILEYKEHTFWLERAKTENAETQLVSLQWSYQDAEIFARTEMIKASYWFRSLGCLHTDFEVWDVGRIDEGWSYFWIVSWSGKELQKLADVRVREGNIQLRVGGQAVDDLWVPAE